MHFSQSEFVATLKQANLLTTDQLDYYLIYEELSNFLPDFNRHTKFQKLYAQCQFMAHKLNLDEFTVNTLMDPESKKSRNFLYVTSKFLIWQKANMEKYQDLNKELEQDQGEINQIQQEIQLKNAQYTELNVEYNKTSQRLDSMKELLLKLQLQIDQHKQQEEMKKLELAKLNQGLLENKNEIQYLNEQILTTQEKKNHLENQIVSDSAYLQESYRQLQAQLDSLEKEEHQKIKEFKLEEFKRQVFQKCEKKIAKIFERFSLFKNANDKNIEYIQQSEREQTNNKEISIRISNLEKDLLTMKTKLEVHRKEQDSIKQENLTLQQTHQNELKLILDTLTSKKDEKRLMEQDIRNLLTLKHQKSSQIQTYNQTLSNLVSYSEQQYLKQKNELQDYTEDIIGKIQQLG